MLAQRKYIASCPVRASPLIRQFPCTSLMSGCICTLIPLRTHIHDLRRRFGDQYTTLKARVLRTLCEAVSPDMPLTTQYGGIVGISRFGPKAVDAFLLPLATSYWTGWETALDARSGSSVEDLNGRFEIQQCQRALLDGLASFMGSVRPEDQAERVDWQTMSEVFGERLIPLQAEPSEFVDCIV